MSDSDYEARWKAARNARMAYAIVVADRRPHKEAAEAIGCSLADVPALVERGRELSARLDGKAVRRG